jgi:ATP-dependent Clp protease ATP-binding subunit ClpB
MGVDGARERVMAEVDRTFRPEFLNRIDEIILFRSLTKEDLKLIVDIQVRHLRDLLEERHVGFDLTEGARRYLVEVGYDPVYGARPLKRVIQRQVQDPLAIALLQGEFADGDTVLVDEREGGIVFAKAS